MQNRSQELELPGSVSGELITRHCYAVCSPHATKLSGCQRTHATFKKLTFKPTGGVGIKVTDPRELNKKVGEDIEEASLNERVESTAG
jgi:hypothetical protein